MKKIRRYPTLLIVAFTLLSLLGSAGALSACERCVRIITIPDPHGGPDFQVSICMGGWDTGAEICFEFFDSCAELGPWCQWTPE